MKKIILPLLLLASSCNVMKGFNEMKEETVKLDEVSNGEKHVAFIGIHHVGKKTYFDNLTTTIKDYKSDGYVVL